MLQLRALLLLKYFPWNFTENAQVMFSRDSSFHICSQSQFPCRRRLGWLHYLLSRLPIVRTMLKSIFLGEKKKFWWYRRQRSPWRLAGCSLLRWSQYWPYLTSPDTRLTQINIISLFHSICLFWRLETIVSNPLCALQHVPISWARKMLGCCPEVSHILDVFYIIIQHTLDFII